MALLELRALPFDAVQLADAVLAHRLPCSLEQLDHSLQGVHEEAARQHDLMEATVVAVEQVEADSRAVHAALRDEQSARKQMELAAAGRLAEAEEMIRRLEGDAAEARDAAARSVREAHAIQLQATDRLAASAQLQQEQASRHAEQLQAVVRAAREQELVAVEAALHDLSAGLRRLCGQLLPWSQAEDVLAAQAGIAGSASARGLEPSVALARQALSCLERLQAAQLPEGALHEIQAQLEQEKQARLLAARAHRCPTSHANANAILYAPARAQEKAAAVCAMEALNEELRALQYRKQDQRQQLVAAAAETGADARRTHLVIEATLVDALHNSDEDRAAIAHALLACKRELREQMRESMRLMQACPDPSTSFASASIAVRAFMRMLRRAHRAVSALTACRTATRSSSGKPRRKSGSTANNGIWMPLGASSRLPVRVRWRCRPS